MDVMVHARCDYPYVVHVVGVAAFTGGEHAMLNMVQLTHVCVCIASGPNTSMLSYAA